MENSHFIFECIREKSLDSLYNLTRDDKRCKELSEKFTDMLFGGMDEKSALKTEETYSELSTRLVEIAYLKGVQDMFVLYKDLSSESILNLYSKVMGEEDADGV